MFLDVLEANSDRRERLVAASILGFEAAVFDEFSHHINEAWKGCSKNGPASIPYGLVDPKIQLEPSIIPRPLPEGLVCVCLGVCRVGLCVVVWA